jgi:hypothetical protein
VNKIEGERSQSPPSEMPITSRMAIRPAKPETQFEYKPMKSRRVLAVMTALLLHPFLGFCADDPYLTRDKVSGSPELKHDLIFREEQDGTAGYRGMIWRIRRDGQWDIVKFKTVEGKTVEFDRTRRVGKLSPEQLERLGRKLAQEGLANLKDELGTDQSINSHNFILTFGEKKSLIGGVEPRQGKSVYNNIMEGSPQLDESKIGDRDRFAKLAKWIEEATSNSNVSKLN